MPFDLDLKVAIYAHVAETTRVPAVSEMAARLMSSPEEIKEAYQRLFRSRVLVLEPDGETIRMAPPFSGVPTQHRVIANGKEYFANCAWDALGVLAALHANGTVHSRCEQSLEPIRIRVSAAGPAPVPCVIHFAVPAAHWWDDIVFT